MGAAAVQSLGSAAVWSSGRTRPLNCSHPPGAAAHDVMDKRLLLQDISFLHGVRLWHELGQLCGLAFSLSGDWKINKHPLLHPQCFVEALLV